MANYGSLNLAVTSPVQSLAEPLTLAQAKKHLNLPDRSPADTEEDDMLADLISAARESAEIAQGRDLVTKQWELSLDHFECYQIELRDPLVSVDLVRYRDSTGNYTSMVDGTDYIVDTAKHPGVVMPPYGVSWPSFTPWPSSAVTILFTSGIDDQSPFWIDAGKRIKQGMLLLISEWFNNRLPLSYDMSVGGVGVVDRINALLSVGSLSRTR